ncbi:sulfur relay protein DsrC, partial [Candidatus Saccharibacteria bacterium]|nr:sulfur relay protein DsrC [Candidatus Saccharibacteria bacterium]
MTTETKQEKTVVLDQDGHLANREDWSEELAQELANLEEVGELTDRHWQVIRYIQKEFDEKGDSP